MIATSGTPAKNYEILPKGSDADGELLEISMGPGEDARVLVASFIPEFRPRIRADFEAIEQLGTLTIPLGPKRERVLRLYLATGYRPLPRTAEYEAQFEDARED
jgi:hypothetical protein